MFSNLTFDTKPCWSAKRKPSNVVDRFLRFDRARPASFWIESPRLDRTCYLTNERQRVVDATEKNRSGSQWALGPSCWNHLSSIRNASSLSFRVLGNILERRRIVIDLRGTGFHVVKVEVVCDEQFGEEFRSVVLLREINFNTRSSIEFFFF